VAREAHVLDFVGVDGEGMTLPSGEHRYVALSVGQATLTHGGEHLTVEEIFAFLWAQFEARPDACFVGFFLGYDFAQWIKTLPESRGRALYQPARRLRTRSGGNPIPYPVYHGQWEFDLLPNGKRFKLRRRGASSWLTICDVGGFFQSSFLTVIDPRSWSDPVCTDAEFATITEGKARRSTATLDQTMIDYNTLENDILARVMARLNEGFVAMGIRLPRKDWYGPGRAAQAYLDLIDAPTAEQLAAAVPLDVLDAARASYYGGHFEIYRHGHVEGDVWECDVNSAYPYAMTHCPCWLHGEWLYDPPEDVTSDFELYHATVFAGHQYVGPLPHRDSRGSIRYPVETTGWYWHHELGAAMAAGLISRDDVYDDHRWVYLPCACPPPLAAPITGLYQERLRVGKNSPQGKAAKLVYNSIYGKKAQSIGHPQYANPLDASYITSHCRSMMWSAVAAHPDGADAVAMVATDGIYLTGPRPVLDEGSGLGQWEIKIKPHLTLHQPGIYWDDHSRASIAAGGSVVLKSRGISAAALSAVIGELDRQWTAFDGTGDWPHLTVPTPFTMVTPKQAIIRHAWDTAGRVTAPGEPREVSAAPNLKRMHAGWVPGMLDTHPWTGRTYAPPVANPISTPYDKNFGMTFEAERADSLSGDDHQDGPLPFSDLW
jgi:hypothetical protein